MTSSKATGDRTCLQTGTQVADIEAGCTLTVTLTPDLARRFAHTWRKNLEADLEGGAPLHPEPHKSAEAMKAYIAHMKRRGEVLDLLGWSEEDAPTEDITLTIEQLYLDEILEDMRDGGDMGPISRENFAQASAAFAILDQLEAAR